MAEPTPSHLITLLEDDSLRHMPDSAIGQRLIELNAGLLHFQAIAASSGSLTVRHAVALGQLFEEAIRRHEGGFGEWLEHTTGEDSEGNPRICRMTAFRYRTLWKKRESLFPADGSEPECRSLTEAYIKVGLIPAPQQGSQEDANKPLFRLTFSVPKTPIEDWPEADRLTFLQKSEPIAEMRARLLNVS